MRAHRTLAPAKVNLGLFVGPARERDGKHELVTVMQSVSLADTVTLEPADDGSERDEVICPALPGPPEQNLAARALEDFRRASGWRSPPVRVRIEKRIPIAAGLAGGSADAAATLRLAAAASGLGDRGLLLELAAALGADVSAQLQPGRWLAGGAGETISALPPPRGALELLLVPSAEGLSTAAVYAEADRLGLGRGEAELSGLVFEVGAGVGDALDPLTPSLLVNDLQAAALSLEPAIEHALQRAGTAGADAVMVSGSGPTVLGLFLGPDGPRAAREAAVRLQGAAPLVRAVTPVGEAFGVAGITREG